MSQGVECALRLPASPFLCSTVYVWPCTQNSCCCLGVKSCQTLAHQAPLSMECPRQEYGVGSHFLLQRIFPTQGSSLCLLHWQADSLPLSHLGGCYIVYPSPFICFCTHVEDPLLSYPEVWLLPFFMPQLQVRVVPSLFSACASFPLSAWEADVALLFHVPSIQ